MTDPTQDRPAVQWLARHRPQVAEAMTSLVAQGEVLDGWAARLVDVYARGGRLLAAGNGGSAAEAQHLTAELVGRFEGERRPLSAIALHADTSSTTAIGNDYGGEEVFARQVEAHGRPGDVLVLLSTSGRSANVVAAAERGRRCGLLVLAMTGPGRSALSEVADETVFVGVEGSSTSAVQEGHLIALHALCAAVDAHLRGETALALPTSGTAVSSPAPSSNASSAARTVEAAVSSLRHEGVRHEKARGSGTRHVVVVGDSVLDVDLLGHSDRIAPDAPVPVVDLTDRQESPGGAGLTALLVAAGGAGVAGTTTTLVTPLSDDDAGRRLRAGLEDAAHPVTVVGLGHRGGTRTKTRVRVAGQSLVRLDEGGPGTPEAVDAGALAAVLATADVVLVSDYGAGTTHDPAVRAALTEAARRVPVVWDPHPRGGNPVPGCALVSPNLSEAKAAAGSPAPTAPDGLAEHLATRWGVQGVVVTTGAQGAWLAAPGTEAMFVPAPVVAVGDPCGAGDRFAASAALSLAAGRLPSEAVVTAVQDASAWVAAGGAAGWRAAQHQPPADPAPVAGGSADAVARVRAAGGTVVATGGCFDVLHAGHVACLEAARRLGDTLVVLLNSDASVRRLKGPGRPVNDQVDRARVIAALDCVDAVVVFDEDDPREALAALQPDVWAKGGDYGGAELLEAPLVRSWGGRVVLLPYLAGRSTTLTLARGAALPTGPAGEH
ncbi:PfkB family carbohydrate kinase [Kineococcus sp. GCM10028916]|uniref:PfkB family carbohydrate kinase n=1 Tax=Kineococcus sp. GCM10028916 TaxID=3273394 RepID=UPI003631CAA0